MSAPATAAAVLLCHCRCGVCRFRLTCVAPVAPTEEPAQQQQSGAAGVKPEGGQAGGGYAGDEYEGLGQAASGAIVVHH